MSLGNVLQESVSSGDNLYAIVDGVVYQIVHGTAGETVQPAVSFIAADAAAGSTCLISQPALNDNSSIMVGNSPETSGLTVAYGADGSLVLEQTALTSYQGHGAGGDSNQMHIVMTADSFGLPGNGLSQVIESSQPPGSQSYVLSSLASYGQTVGESGAQIQTKTNDVVGLSINSEVGLLAPSGETAALAVLSVASDVLPDGAPRVPQTVLADECSDDEEFVYLVADKDDSASLTDNSKTLPAFEQSSGFLDSYVKFVRGDVVETLSAVANSTVLERPPLPRYIPELSHQRPGPRETLITESGPFACENGSDVTRSHRGCATVDIVNCSKGRNLLPTSSSKSEQGLVGSVDNSLGLRTISVQSKY